MSQIIKTYPVAPNAAGLGTIVMNIPEEYRRVRFYVNAGFTAADADELYTLTMNSINQVIYTARWDQTSILSEYNIDEFFELNQPLTGNVDFQWNIADNVPFVITMVFRK